MTHSLKHAPATPLPWHYHRAPKIGGGTVQIIQQRNLRGVTVASFSAGSGSDRIDSICEQNAAYIAHAANAYPKLVEAVRLMRELGERSICYPRSDSKRADFERTIDHARAILRELGEE